MNIVLGSSSPRRKNILENLVKDFTIISPDIDETIKNFETPEEYACRISEEKNNSICSKLKQNEETLVITSDTIVTINGEILGKPDGFNGAVRTLSILSGREHQVMTSVTLNLIMHKKNSKPLTSIESSSVFFKDLNFLDIEKYLIKTNFEDKAGAYAIQENGEMIISNIKGSKTNIIGFPLRLFFRMTDELKLQNKLF